MKQIMLIAKDPDGLPRVWVTGRADRESALRAILDRMIAQYRDKKRVVYDDYLATAVYTVERHNLPQKES